MVKEYLVNSRPKRAPTHPGILLREDVLPTMGISVSEFANKIGVSRQMLHRILAGTHSITPEMALRIGKFIGNGPGIWIRMQQNYDLWQAERSMEDILDAIPYYGDKTDPKQVEKK